MKRHRQSLEVDSNMNITNLLDVVLVLLCAFMIVAPTLKSGIPVELPQVENPSTMTEDEDKSIEVTIARKDLDSVGDKILIDGQRKDLADLDGIFQQRKAKDPEVSVTIRGDQQAMFDTGVQILAKANAAGIESFAFSTEPASAAKPPKAGNEE